MRNLLLMSLTMLLLLVGCGSDDAGNAPTATPDDVPEGTPVAIHGVESLREQAAELDGTVVMVRSNYWSDGESQYLSDILMESYPPQVPVDQAVVLHGDMPESVLELLNEAERSSTSIIWGEVDITGEVQVEGDEVHLEIHEAYAVQG